MLITRKLNPLSKICSPDDMIFHETLSSEEGIYSFPLHFSGQKQNKDLCTFSVGLAGRFCSIFLLRGQILTLCGSCCSTQSFPIPDSVNHTILILYSQTKALLNGSSPVTSASLSIKDSPLPQASTISTQLNHTLYLTTDACVSAWGQKSGASGFNRFLTG